MAIQKMMFLKIAGSLQDMHDVLKKLVLCENFHLDFENIDSYDNSFIIHEYESMYSTSDYKREDIDAAEARCAELEQMLERLSKGLAVDLVTDKNSIAEINYTLKDADADINRLLEESGPVIDEINLMRASVQKYEQFREKLSSVIDKELEFDRLAGFHYFDYELGALTKENRIRLRKNYENISALALNIGSIKYSVEDLYLIIFPKQLKDETAKLLKALNWVRYEVPEGLSGSVSNMIRQVNEKIAVLKKEIDELSGVLKEKKEETRQLLNKIFSIVKLEEKIIGMEREIFYGENSFVLNAWVRKNDSEKIRQLLNSVTKNIIIEEKNVNEIGRQVMPPTQFKNNRFFRPFETIIRLYGLPSYYEIDPTPFIAITFCLMFGIMFGDIGQGLVYFIVGVFLYKKSRTAGQILTRLGGSSVVFGFVYGSLFGLEQEELPWLPSLIGKPLDPRNIPAILITGVVFGVVVLSVSFIFGIINSIRLGNIEDGIFGKNGAAGYIFFLGLVFSGVCITGAIGVPIGIPLAVMVLSLTIMLFKQPLANLAMNSRPIIHGSAGSYFTESIFEGVETVLGTLSNTISFIRIGAFALNHAGLFLAFLVMSEMMSNTVLKFIILLLGNLLILTLEGLVVFIQGLRLQYYEMFSKYFRGDGVPFNPVKLEN